VFFFETETHVLCLSLKGGLVCVSFLKRERLVCVFLQKGDSFVCLSSKGGLICVSFFKRGTHLCVFLWNGDSCFVSFSKRETVVRVFL